MTIIKNFLFVLFLASQLATAATETQCVDKNAIDCTESEDDSDEYDFNEYGVPVDWEGYDLNDFWDAFECDELFRSVRPIHNESTWSLIRGVYLGIVGLEGFRPGTNVYDNSFSVLHKVAQTAGKGRGVHAAEEVKEGTLVWESHYTGCFEEEYDYRLFLVTIPSDLACDVMQWAYGEDISIYESAEENDLADEEKSNKVLMCCDLDEGSLVNTGTHDFEDFEVFEDRKHNVKSKPNNLRIEIEDGLSKMYAIRDIHLGEEFLVSYSDFAVMNRKTHSS